jgi:hypothetical protein
MQCLKKSFFALFVAFFSVAVNAATVVVSWNVSGLPAFDGCSADKIDFDSSLKLNRDLKEIWKTGSIYMPIPRM